MNSYLVAFCLLNFLQYLSLVKCNNKTECTLPNQVYFDPAIDPVDSVCQLGCKAGCYCMNGFKFDRKKEKCLPEGAKDSKTCEENEYLSCGELFCSKYCETDRDPICELGHLDCTFSYGCFCKPGYLRILSDHKWICVPTHECPYYVISHPGF